MDFQKRNTAYGGYNGLGSWAAPKLLQSVDAMPVSRGVPSSPSCRLVLCQSQFRQRRLCEDLYQHSLGIMCSSLIIWLHPRIKSRIFRGKQMPMHDYLSKQPVLAIRVKDVHHICSIYSYFLTHNIILVCLFPCPP